jgi:hypothetical protein
MDLDRLYQKSWNCLSQHCKSLLETCSKARLNVQKLQEQQTKHVGVFQSQLDQLKSALLGEELSQSEMTSMTLVYDAIRLCPLISSMQTEMHLQSGTLISTSIPDHILGKVPGS